MASRSRLFLLIVSTILPLPVASAQSAIYTNRLAVGNAIESDNAVLLQEIAQRGGNMEEMNLFGLTPLMEAARNGSPRCAAFLISRNVPLETRSMDGFPAVYYAVYLDPGDPYRNDPSYLKGRAAVLSELIQAGADYRGTYWNVRGFGLVHLAVLGDNLPCLQVLVASGADVNAVGNYDETPLMVAAGHGYLPMVRYLVAQGADLKAETVAGQNALDFARSWPAVVSYLKSAGATAGSFATQMYQAFGEPN